MPRAAKRARTRSSMSFFLPHSQDTRWVFDVPLWEEPIRRVEHPNVVDHVSIRKLPIRDVGHRLNSVANSNFCNPPRGQIFAVVVAFRAFPEQARNVPPFLVSRRIETVPKPRLVEHRSLRMRFQIPHVGLNQRPQRLTNKRLDVLRIGQLRDEGKSIGQSAFSGSGPAASSTTRSRNAGSSNVSLDPARSTSPNLRGLRCH